MLDLNFDAAGEAADSGGDARLRDARDGDLLDAYSRAVIAVVDAVGPAVVRVETPPDPAQRKPGGSGSGVIISPDGLILTNSHVVQGERAVSVTLTDSRRVEARVLGDDPDTDLALLRANDGANLPAARKVGLEAYDPVHLAVEHQTLRLRHRSQNGRVKIRR